MGGIRKFNIASYKPIIAAVQNGHHRAAEILKATGVRPGAGYSRLSTLAARKIFIKKKDGYYLAPGHELSQEEIEQLSQPSQEAGERVPELARIERRITNWLEQGKGLIDEVRALAPLIVSPQERAAIEGLRRAGLRIKG